MYDVWNSPKQLESVFKQLKSFVSGGLCPPDPCRVSVISKIKIFLFQSFMLSNQVFKIKMGSN